MAVQTKTGRSTVFFCGSLFLCVCLIAAFFIATSPFPPLPILIVFTILIVISNQDVLVEGTSAVMGFSPAGSLLIAAVVAFRPYNAPAGPLIVGFVGWLFFLPQFRNHEWSKIIFNVSNISLTAVALTVILWNLPNQLYNSVGGVLIVGIIATFVFEISNSCLFAILLAINANVPISSSLRELFPVAIQAVPFTALGAFLGIAYIQYGVLLVLLFVVPIFIGRATYSSYVNLKNAQDATVRTLISALEAKDPYTAGHAERVAKYAEYIGEEFNFTPGRMERLKFAAQMHDIGKLIVPNHILNKPGRLTESEFEEIKKHEEVSVQMLNRIDFLKPIAPAVMDHNHFSEDDSEPIEPFIVAAADAYDAMTSSRSYRKALSQEVAFQELRDKSGTQFHPKVAEALIHALEKRGEKHGAGYETGAVHEDAPVAGLGSGGLGNLEPEQKSPPHNQEQEPEPDNVVEFPKRAAS